MKTKNSILGPLPKYAALLAVTVSTSLAAVIWWLDVASQQQRSLTSLSILNVASEMAHESSANLARAIDNHRRLLQMVSETIDSGSMGIVYRFRQDLDPSSRIMSALNSISVDHENSAAVHKALNSAAQELESLGTIPNQGNVVTRFIPTRTMQSEKHRLLVFDEMKNCSQAAVVFRDNPSFLTAEEACMQSRFANAALLNAWNDFRAIERQRTAARLVGDMAELVVGMLALSEKLPAEQSETVKKYAANIQTRVDFLTKLNSSDIAGARQVLITSYSASVR